MADSPDDVELAAMVRRLGGIERQLDQVGGRLAALEDRIDTLAEAITTHVPRMQRDVVASAAMVDAVAAQVAADTDAIVGRLDRLDPPGSRGTDPPGGFWRRLFGGGPPS